MGKSIFGSKESSSKSRLASKKRTHANMDGKRELEPRTSTRSPTQRRDWEATSASRKLLITQMQQLIASKACQEGDYDSWSELEEEFSRIYQPIHMDKAEMWAAVEAASPSLRRRLEAMARKRTTITSSTSSSTTTTTTTTVAQVHRDSWSSRASSILNNPEAIYVSREEVLNNISNDNLDHDSWSSRATSILNRNFKEPNQEHLDEKTSKTANDPDYISRAEMLRKLEDSMEEIEERLERKSSSVKSSGLVERRCQGVKNSKASSVTSSSDDSSTKSSIKQARTSDSLEVTASSSPSAPRPRWTSRGSSGSSTSKKSSSLLDSLFGLRKSSVAHEKSKHMEEKVEASNLQPKIVNRQDALKPNIASNKAMSSTSDRSYTTEDEYSMCSCTSCNSDYDDYSMCSCSCDYDSEFSSTSSSSSQTSVHTVVDNQDELPEVPLTVHKDNEVSSLNKEIGRDKCNDNELRNFLRHLDFTNMEEARSRLKQYFRDENNDDNDDNDDDHVDRRVEMLIRQLSDTEFETLSNKNVGQVYIPLEKEETSLMRSTKTSMESSMSSKEEEELEEELEEDEYDTFGSIDSLIFEPRDLEMRRRKHKRRELQLKKNEAAQKTVEEQFNYLDNEDDNCYEDIFSGNKDDEQKTRNTERALVQTESTRTTPKPLLSHTMFKKRVQLFQNMGKVKESASEKECELNKKVKPPAKKITFLEVSGQETNWKVLANNTEDDKKDELDEDKKDELNEDKKDNEEEKNTKSVESKEEVKVCKDCGRPLDLSLLSSQSTELSSYETVCQSTSCAMSSLSNEKIHSKTEMSFNNLSSATASFDFLKMDNIKPESKLTKESNTTNTTTLHTARVELEVEVTPSFMEAYSVRKSLDDSSTSSSTSSSTMPLLLREGSTVYLTEAMFRGRLKGTLKRVETNKKKKTSNSSEMGDSGIVSPINNESPLDNNNASRMIRSPIQNQMDTTTGKNVVKNDVNQGQGATNKHMGRPRARRTTSITKESEDKSDINDDDHNCHQGVEVVVNRPEEEVKSGNKKSLLSAPTNGKRDTMIRELKSKLKEKFNNEDDEDDNNEDDDDDNNNVDDADEVAKVGHVEERRKSIGPTLSRLLTQHRAQPLAEDVEVVAGVHEHEESREARLLSDQKCSSRSMSVLSFGSSTTTFKTLYEQRQNGKMLNHSSSSIYDPSLPSTPWPQIRPLKQSNCSGCGDKLCSVCGSTSSCQSSSTSSVQTSNYVDVHHLLVAAAPETRREVVYGPGGVFGPKGVFSTPSVRYPHHLEVESNLLSKPNLPEPVLDEQALEESRSSRMEPYRAAWHHRGDAHRPLLPQDAQRWHREKASRMLAWINSAQLQGYWGADTPWWKAKQRASLRWLIATAHEQQVPKELREPFIQHQEKSKTSSPLVHPSIRDALITADLYCRVLYTLFKDDHLLELNHWGVIQSLGREGVLVAEPTDCSPMTEATFISTTPLHMKAHLAVMEALMTLYIRERVDVAHVIQVSKRIWNKRDTTRAASSCKDDGSCKISSTLKMDAEEALLYWLKCSCALLQYQIELETKPYTVAMPKVSTLNDLTSGVALASLLSLYFPNTFPWHHLALANPPSMADSLSNLQRMRRFCHNNLDLCHLEVEDIVYMHASIRLNVVCFIADLFHALEVEPCKQAITPRCDDESTTSSMPVQPCNSLAIDSELEKTSKTTTTTTTTAMMSTMTLETTVKLVDNTMADEQDDQRSP